MLADSAFRFNTFNMWKINDFLINATL